MLQVILTVLVQRQVLHTWTSRPSTAVFKLPSQSADNFMGPTPIMRVTWRWSLHGGIFSLDTAMSASSYNWASDPRKHSTAHWVRRLTWSQMCWLSPWQCCESWLIPLLSVLHVVLCFHLRGHWRRHHHLTFLLFAPTCQRTSPQGDWTSHLGHTAHSWLFPLFLMPSFFLGQHHVFIRGMRSLPFCHGGLSYLLSSSHVLLYYGCLALKTGYLLKATALTFKDGKDYTLRSLLSAYSCRNRGFSDGGKRLVDRI